VGTTKQIRIDGGSSEVPGAFRVSYGREQEEASAVKSII
jgi:hypothetical protein